MAEWQRKIKYEAELDHGFGAHIATRSRGENLNACIQCGTCSGTCPMSIYMDYTPRKIIAMTRAGFRDEVLHSQTIWLCASCYECTVECPKQIRITDVMYALKQEAIQQKVYPKRFPIPVLAREFFKVVQREGRNSELEVIIRLYLKTNAMRFLSQGLLGLRLFLTGRIGLKGESVEHKDELKAILRAVEQQSGNGIRKPTAEEAV